MDSKADINSQPKIKSASEVIGHSYVYTDSIKLGLHITAIRKFLSDHPQIRENNLTTSQINSAVIKPETKATNSRYIEKYIDLCDASNGKPLVAPATVFVSHAWRYEFCDVVGNVLEQHAVKHPESYFWFDLFTNNQNEVASKDFDWFSSTFREGVREIGQVLLILAPWYDPIPVRRAWCLFEIFSALDDPNLILHIKLPDSERAKLRSTLREDSEHVLQALSDIRAQNADAKVERERDLILDVIRSSAGGFSHVNSQVKNGLVVWYVTQLKTLIDLTPNDYQLRLNSARFMYDVGLYDDALENAEKCLEAIESDQWRDLRKFSKCHTYQLVAHLYGKRSMFQHAIGLYEQANDELDSYGLDVCYTGIAQAYFDNRQYNQALKYHKMSLDIKQRVQNPDDVAKASIAETYNSMGNVCRVRGELSDASWCIKKSLKICLKLSPGSKRELLLASNNMVTAELYNDRKMSAEALEFYGRSLEIYLDQYGGMHHTVAHIYQRMASIHLNSKDYDKALECAKSALNILQQIKVANNPAKGSIYQMMADIYWKQENFKAALECWVVIKEMIKPPNFCTFIDGVDFERVLSWIDMFEHLLRRQR